MAISTYSELKTEITDFMEREDISGKAEVVVKLAEARLNRKLESVEADVTLTGTVNSRSIDISSYSVIEGIALFLLDDDGDEIELTKRPEGTFPQTADTGEPEIWALDGDNIDFDCKLDEAYTFRFRYVGRFALSDAAPTNDLLTNHPDVYLAACVVWGGMYTQNADMVVGYKALLDEFIRETQVHLSKRKRGVLTVDPAILAVNNYQRGTWDGNK